MEPFLSLRHVSKTFHANRALNDISIDFMPGEVHCLAGQNGCGKSTLIKIISGVYRPDEGAAMTLGGKTWPKLTPAASVAHGIQVIYQDLSLFPNLSVWENIAINHYHRGVLVRRSELRRSAEQAMRSINVRCRWMPPWNRSPSLAVSWWLSAARWRRMPGLSLWMNPRPH